MRAAQKHPKSEHLKPETRLAQCAACGEVFGGTEAFDRHLLAYEASENCQHPSNVLHRDGWRILTQGPDGIWRRAYGR